MRYRLIGSSHARTALTLAALSGLMLTAQGLGQALPPPPVPAQNPITEPKRVLGKILFFDEQLSPSNVVSCATCHQPARGGTDPRIARHPGLDGILNNGDDVFGSPGVIRSNTLNQYERDPVFLLQPQVTARAANPMINAAYFTDLFWDGRARSEFRDPLTNAVVIPAGGALESQAVGPPLSSVEMAHAGMDWSEIVQKLAVSRPLDLATGIPPDVAGVLANRPTYQELFQQAFGDGEITPSRIAFAMATYQRTLISDQSPWDRFIAGEATALTANQQAGWSSFQSLACVTCHAPPHFSDNSFRNIGLRPIVQDNGRQSVTGNINDRGKFKVPHLRNLSQRSTFMHTGQFTNLGQVLGFYAGAGGVPLNAPIRDNRDPLMNTFNPPGQPANLPPAVSGQIQDFLLNGLLDERVQNGTFPFDRATLYTQRPGSQPTILAGGNAGSGGIQPNIIAQSPPMLGLKDFRIGLNNALGGATATLKWSSGAPVNSRIPNPQTLLTISASGVGHGNGVATAFMELSPAQFASGQVIFMQWFITDPGADGGEAASNVARVTFFCGSSGCPGTKCNAADITGVGGQKTPPDNQLTVDDIIEFVNTFGDSSGCPGTGPCSVADICGIGGLPAAPDGQLTVDDLIEFVNAFGDGC